MVIHQMRRRSSVRRHVVHAMRRHMRHVMRRHVVVGVHVSSMRRTGHRVVHVVAHDSGRCIEVSERRTHLMTGRWSTATRTTGRTVQVRGRRLLWTIGSESRGQQARRCVRRVTGRWAGNGGNGSRTRNVRRSG